jgi:S-DNA-T family DNA segregation ATPase FtsK/SpoIIIE
LLIAVVSACAHLLTGSGNWPEMRGGVLGYVIAGWLQKTVNWMAIPLLGYSLFLGLLFTAEELVFRFPAAFRKRKDQLAGIAGGVVPAAQKISSIAQPIRRAVVGLAGGASTQLADVEVDEDEADATELRINPGRRRTKAAVDEEEQEVEDELLDDQEHVAEEDEEDYEEDEDVEEDEQDDVTEEGEESDPQMVVNVSKPPELSEATLAAIPAKPYPTELGEWQLPSVSLLADPEYLFSSQQETVVREKARILEQTLQDYRIEANVVEIDTGPVITMYELNVAPGVKVSQILSLANDIARAMRAPSVRVVAPIPGKNTIGIEVPNLDKEIVRLKELMTVTGAQARKMSLPLYLGKDASGNPLVSDLTKMPHMLIAGTTGSGKSVCINAIIASFMMTQRPDWVKLILVDPKMVEMSSFRDVPHLMCPIVTELDRAEKILEWATVKMDERYALLAEAGVRNIAAYNRLTKEEKYERFQPTTDDEKAQIPLHLPYIVIIIDELADLMMISAKDVELYLSRLAQKSRAVGVHIIVATQRPEAKIVTGLVKSNLPCRIAFRVSSRMDSRIVLDQNGAEVLMGQGDMLFLPPGDSKLVRAQGTFLDDNELKAIIKYLGEKGEPEFHPELIKLGKQDLSSDGPRDELFDQAVEIVLQSKRGSVSLLQRRLTIGYSRASRLIEEMGACGIVGEYKGSQAREVLITDEEWEALKEQEAARIRSVGLQGDGVPDMLYDDDM